MTTAAEIRQILANYLAEAQRVVLRPSGFLASDGGRDELAKEMVALANRDGGRILLGIDRDGTFEGQLEVGHDQAEEALRELLSSRITPALDARLEHLSTPDGELLIIGVPRRAGPPHAFARVTPKGSVAGRAFLVRDGARTLPVSDAQLRWLFEVESDPAVAETCRLVLQLPGDGLVPVECLPQPRAAAAFGEILSGLDARQVSELIQAPARLESAFLEVAPFLLLRELVGFSGTGNGPGIRGSGRSTWTTCRCPEGARSWATAATACGRCCAGRVSTGSGCPARASCSWTSCSTRARRGPWWMPVRSP